MILVGHPSKLARFGLAHECCLLETAIAKDAEKGRAQRFSLLERQTLDLVFPHFRVEPRRQFGPKLGRARLAELDPYPPRVHPALVFFAALADAIKSSFESW